MLNIAIMCGGSGTRLWPLSRSSLPKQFIKIDGEKTLFQIACLRVQPLQFQTLYVICNVMHQFLVEKQLKEINIMNYILILEPFGKNTAAAIASTCLNIDPNDNLLVMTADHVWNDDAFCQSINDNINLTKDGIVVFGIKPTRPECGYGYIHFNKDRLLKFVEKPDIERATQYYKSDKYLWNSGNFLFNVGIMVDEFKNNAPDVLESVKLTMNKSTISTHLITLDKDSFEKVPNISIDYAIMEHHQNGRVIQYNNYWSDIGAFDSLYQHLDKDSNGNAIVLASQDSLQIDTNNCLIWSNPRVTTTSIGVKDLAIINTPDCLLVADLNKSQSVKDLVNEIKSLKVNTQILEFNRTVDRPWGWYTNLEGDDHTGFKVKRIGVYPGKRLSLQSHNNRSEHWVIVKGKATVTVGEDFHELNVNQSIMIPKGVKHRMENNTEDLIEFVETQIGDYLGEDDIIRYQDDFGRT